MIIAIIAISSEVLRDAQETHLLRDLCEDLIVEVELVTRAAADLQRSNSGESKTPAPGRPITQREARAAGTDDLVLRRVTSATAFANRVIQEYLPQQSALGALRNLGSARRMLGKFEDARERLARAREALELEDRRQRRDLMDAFRQDVSRALDSVDAMAVLAREERDQQRAFMTELLHHRHIAPELPPRPAEGDAEKVANRLTRLCQDRKALAELEQRGHLAPLPPKLEDGDLREQGRLGGFVDMARGSYQGSNVLVKTFVGVDLQAAALEMRLHYRAQQQCGDWVVRIEAASIERSTAKLVLQDAECTLHHLIERRRGEEWPMLRLLRLVLHAVDGTIKLHERRMYHRSLNPYAVLVARDAEGRDVALLSDFSTARSSKGRAGTLSMSAHGQPRGALDPLPTLKYRAPEVNTGTHGAHSHKKLMGGDVFSLGVMLNAVLQGREPYPHVRDQSEMMTVARSQAVPEVFDAEAVVPLLVDEEGQTRRDVAADLQRLVAACFLPPRKRTSMSSLRYGLAQAVCTLGGSEQGPAMPPPPPRPQQLLLDFLARELGAEGAQGPELQAVIDSAQQLLGRIEALPRNPHAAMGPEWLAMRLLLERARLNTST